MTSAPVAEEGQRRRLEFPARQAAGVQRRRRRRLHRQLRLPGGLLEEEVRETCCERGELGNRGKCTAAGRRADRAHRATARRRGVGRTGTRRCFNQGSKTCCGPDQTCTAEGSEAGGVQVQACKGRTCGSDCRADDEDCSTMIIRQTFPRLLNWDGRDQRCREAVPLPVREEECCGTGYKWKKGHCVLDRRSAGPPATLSAALALVAAERLPTEVGNRFARRRPRPRRSRREAAKDPLHTGGGAQPARRSDGSETQEIRSRNRGGDGRLAVTVGGAGAREQAAVGQGYKVVGKGERMGRRPGSSHPQTDSRSTRAGPSMSLTRKQPRPGVLRDRNVPPQVGIGRRR